MERCLASPFDNRSYFTTKKERGSFVMICPSCLYVVDTTEHCLVVGMGVCFHVRCWDELSFVEQDAIVVSERESRRGVFS